MKILKRQTCPTIAAHRLPVRLVYELVLPCGRPRSLADVWYCYAAFGLAMAALLAGFYTIFAVQEPGLVAASPFWNQMFVPGVIVILLGIAAVVFKHKRLTRNTD